MVMKMPFQMAGIGELSGPVPLGRRGMRLPNVAGLYVVMCGDCVAHVGTSGKLAQRVGELARLGSHKGSSEVLCAAFCSAAEPVVWWKECQNVVEARKLEGAIKEQIGEPPVPGQYQRCKNGGELCNKLVEAAGPSSWEAGYIEAVFAIGERLNLLFMKRFEPLWQAIGKPPGPWCNS